MTFKHYHSFVTTYLNCVNVIVNKVVICFLNWIRLECLKYFTESSTHSSEKVDVFGDYVTIDVPGRIIAIAYIHANAFIKTFDIIVNQSNEL